MHSILKRLLPLFLLSSCLSIKYSGNKSAAVNKTIAANEETQGFIEPYKAELAKSMNKFIAVFDTSYQKSKPNGNLNNLCATLIHNHAQTKSEGAFIAFGVLNYGGLRASLPSDSIFVRNIYELSPFENNLVILELSPENCDSLFRYLKNRAQDPLSGLSINQNTGKVLVLGAPYDSRRSYRFVTNDYMANGGDGFGILMNPKYRKDLPITMRDALLAQLKWEYRTYGLIKQRNKEVFIRE